MSEKHHEGGKEEKKDEAGHHEGGHHGPPEPSKLSKKLAKIIHLWILGGSFMLVGAGGAMLLDERAQKKGEHHIEDAAHVSPPDHDPNLDAKILQILVHYPDGRNKKIIMQKLPSLTEQQQLKLLHDLESKE